jgi:hypothetical protein
LVKNSGCPTPNATGVYSPKTIDPLTTPGLVRFPGRRRA